MAFGLVLLLLALAGEASYATPLDDYVNGGPDFIKYEMLPEADLKGTSKHGPTKGMSWTAKAVNLTSQAWMTEDEWGADWGGEDAHWWHYMMVITPDIIADGRETWNGLYVTGGKNTAAAPGRHSEDIMSITELAMSTGMTWTVLFQVPNFPIYLRNPDGTTTGNLGEDAMLSYTFVRYMDFVKNGGDPQDAAGADWAVLLPMTKSVFAAMAASEEVCGFLPKDGAKMEWVMTGASKRGWTTWLAGAVDMARPEKDRRIRSIAPIVLDGLSFDDMLHMHWGAYGGWSFTMSSFIEAGFTARLDDKETEDLWRLVDPVYYVERFKGLPKLVADSTGDEWFLPDDSKHWIAAMQENGPVSLTMIPDADHSMVTGLPALIPTIGSFALSSLQQRAWPQFTWDMDLATGSMTVKIDPEFADLKRTVQLWQSHTNRADSPRRDFRLVNMDQKYSGECKGGIASADGQQCLNTRTGFWNNATLAADVELDASGLVYSASVQVPPRAAQEWVAFFVEVTFHDVSPDVVGSGQQGGEGATVDDATYCSGGRDQRFTPRDGGRRHCIPRTNNGDAMLATQVGIVPDYLPYQCYGKDCEGSVDAMV